MPAKRRSVQRGQRPDGHKPKAKPAKTVAAQQGMAAGKSPAAKATPVDTLKRTIAYFYLLSYCPPGRITDWAQKTAQLRKELAESAGMSEAAYFGMVTPEVCRRIVSFHQSTREPDQDWIDTLIDAAGGAAGGAQKAEAFQQAMTKVAGLPQRAKPEGWLHRKKGCQFCKAPCSYGYFTLISDPQFNELQELFAAEARKPAGQQSPWNPCLRFTLDHLQKIGGARQEFIEARHLVNLSYCLLMLSIAKSRLPVPEQQLRLFQAAGQRYVQSAVPATSSL